MRSMTGFGEASAERDGVFVAVEISSVNSRHHNIKTNLSDYPKFERRVEMAVRERVDRGKVEVQFHSNLIGNSVDSVQINQEMSEFYVDRFRQLAEQHQLPLDSISVNDLFDLPGVVETGRQAELDDQTEQQFISVLNQALDGLIEMRENEGTSIADDLRQRSETIRSLLDRIEERIPEALQRYRDNLLEQLEDIFSMAEQERDERLENEMKKYAEKCDISEEVVRIESHMDQFEQYLGQEGTVGKNLEFLIQEIQREINTVGAKANDAQISQLAVDVKSELEKCREQVKNVE